MRHGADFSAVSGVISGGRHLNFFNKTDGLEVAIAIQNYKIFLGLGLGGFSIGLGSPRI